MPAFHVRALGTDNATRHLEGMQQRLGFRVYDAGSETCGVEP